jgi:hypothetical protein
MSTKYLVTPHKGRVGNARQIAPFPIETKTLPHDLGAIGTALCDAVHKIAKRRDLLSSYDFGASRGQFKFEVFDRGDTLVGRFYVDQIEE